MCWGESLYGQLGYGNTTTIHNNEAPGWSGPVESSIGSRSPGYHGR